MLFTRYLYQKSINLYETKPVIISLLTHQTELGKTTNTGPIAIDHLNGQAGCECHRVIWQRKEPDTALLSRLATLSSGLIYPTLDARPLAAISTQEIPKHLVIIDSTWQQARKIYNHSPYLQALPTFALTEVQVSRFTLRRNQVEGGLCTVETVAELAKLKGLPKLAGTLYRELDQFITKQKNQS